MTAPVAPTPPADPDRHDLFGLAPTVCEPKDLQRADARALAHRIGRGIPFARLVECRRGLTGDLVVMDVDVEAPQHTAYDIRLEERIGVWFEAAPAPPVEPAPPDAFALREDFPGDVPHVNQRTYSTPRSLCLYDVPFAEVRAGWTPARFVTLVRNWLRLTARGELHAADQPLEPLMLAPGGIILPNILRAQDAVFGVVHRGEFRGLPMLVAVPPAEVPETERRWVVACVRAAPRTHGVIHRTPITLADLHAMLAPEDDVRGHIAAVVRQWRAEGRDLNAQVAIVLLVPFRRQEGTAPEIEQPWAFLTVDSVAAVGESLGLWERGPHGLGTIIGGIGGDGGASIKLLALNAYFQQRREDSARYNGRRGADERHFVAIGAGALGSQVLDALGRAAFGRWTVVDGDVLLPHNLARHALTENAVGWEKARGVAVGVLQAVTEDGNVHDSLVADVLAPGEQREALDRAYTNAAAIIDMSASVAVARALAREVTAPARRASLFLNPTGTDLMLLAESADRAVRLDGLEMQYYRAVAHDPALAGTLRGAVARERYGRSCRDVSTQIPQARIAALAGIGAQAVERMVDDELAAIRVWRFDETTLAVQAIEVPLHATAEAMVGDWHVVTDAGLLVTLRELRSSKLPNETGGVLLGSVDVARRVVYIVDTIPSPPDSREWPTLYIRGAAGLAAGVEQVETATAGQLHYIGEWHSHPAGCPPLPSSDDLQVFAWITTALDADDLPAVMMIVGDNAVAAFVGSIEPGRAPALLGLAEPPLRDE